MTDRGDNYARAARLAPDGRAVLAAYGRGATAQEFEEVPQMGAVSERRNASARAVESMITDLRRDVWKGGRQLGRDIQRTLRHSGKSLQRLGGTLRRDIAAVGRAVAAGEPKPQPPARRAPRRPPAKAAPGTTPPPRTKRGPDFVTRFAARRSRGEMVNTEAELYRTGTPQDVTSVRAKSQRHRKSTADRWNQ